MASMIWMVIIFQISSFAQCSQLIDSGDVFYSKFLDQKAYGFYSKALETCPDYESLMKTTRALNDIGEDIGGKKGGSFFIRALRYTDTMQYKYPDSLQSYFLKAAAAGNLALYKGGKTKVELAKTVESNAKKSISIDSTYAPSHVILGVYYRQVATAGNFQKSLARALYKQNLEGSLSDSERELLKAIALDSQNIFAHYELAQTWHAMKRRNEAREQLKKTLTVPDNDNQAAKIKREAQEDLKHWK